MEGALVWLTYQRAPGVGRRRLVKLMERHRDPYTAWRLGAAELAEVEGFGPATAEAIVAVRRNLIARREAERDLERAQKAGLRVLCYPDAHYPGRLRETPDPPPILYQGGPWEPDQQPIIAIVGTRKPSAYGLAVAEQLGRDFARLGAVVVSGMARGIDTAAHKGAIAAGGRSIAVLGGGADICYPREATFIYRAMRESGAILSEQPPGTEPRRENFPERNRIISGVSHAVVVVEAGKYSGTLITAAHATVQSRDLFAVPGPITSPLSQGPHKLLRDGAGLVISARQVLEDLGFLTPPEGKLHWSAQGLSEVEMRVLGWMGASPCWPDDLSETSGLSIAEVQACLTMLEIRSAIRRLPDGQYVRIG